MYAYAISICFHPYFTLANITCKLRHAIHSLFSACALRILHYSASLLLLCLLCILVHCHVKEESFVYIGGGFLEKLVNVRVRLVGIGVESGNQSKVLGRR